jgi:hypothetical protein
MCEAWDLCSAFATEAGSTVENKQKLKPFLYKISEQGWMYKISEQGWTVRLHCMFQSDLEMNGLGGVIDNARERTMHQEVRKT